MKNKVFRLISALMIVICIIGAYGVVFGSSRVKAAQRRIEREILREQRRIEAERQAALEEQARLRAEREAQRQRYIEEISCWNGYKTPSDILITGVGDSVMVSCYDALCQKFPNGYFDAKFGRRIAAGTSVLKNLADSGSLGDVVFLSLFTNYSADITKDQVEELVKICDGRPVFFTTAYGINNQSSNNIVYELAEEYDNVYIVNWREYASGHPEWILEDGLHPNKEGARAYAQLLYDRIYEELFPTREEIDKMVEDKYAD